MSSSLTPQNFLSPEKITPTPTSESYSFSSDELEQALDSFSLSGGEDDDFGIPNLTYTLTAAAAAYQDNTPLTLATATASSSSTYVWTKGIKTKNNTIVGGYYDANKVNPYAGGSDCNMCWAGSASNMIAWWQNRYKTTTRIGSSVATTAQGIMAKFRAYWTNDGGYADQGVAWWLAGDSTLYMHYSSSQSTIKSKYSSKSTGGYYKSLYTASDAKALISNIYLNNYPTYTASKVASELASAFNRGAVVGISITKYSSDSHHALSIWGIKRNSSGTLNTIYITDSNDGNKGTRVCTVKVSYDSYRERYKLTSGTYKGWHLTGYQVLEAFNKTNYSIPGSGKVKKSGKYVTFKWSNKSKGSGITHQVAYKKKGASSFTYVSTSSSSLKVELPTDGTYEWRVRTKVGTAFTSDWLKPGKFTFTGAPPKITFYSTTQSKISSTKVKIGIGWKSNEKATFELRLDGKLVYKGSGKTISRRYFTVKNGTHTYKLTAKDKYGNKSYYSGKLVCGDVTPPTISNLTATTSNSSTSGKSNVSFSWDSSEKATYILTLNGKLIYKGSSTSFSYSSALADGTYSYKLTATDAAGNSSSKTSSFTCEASTSTDDSDESDKIGANSGKYNYYPSITSLTATTTRASAGQSCLTISWSATLSPTYTLTIDGLHAYTGTATSYTCPTTIPDGTYSYELTATSSYGFTSSKSGSFTCNTTTAGLEDTLTLTSAPEAPALDSLALAASGDDTALTLPAATTAAAAASTNLDAQLALSAGDLCLLGSADYSSCGCEACAALLEDAAALEEKRNAALAAAL